MSTEGDFRRRETLQTILERHRQSSRMLAESSQAEWRAMTGAGVSVDKYHKLASTTAELARLLAPRISDTKFWDMPLTHIVSERLRENVDLDETDDFEHTRRDSETVTLEIEVTLQWLVNGDGTYTDLEYDGDEPYSAPGMLTNVTPPQTVEKPLPPNAVRSCHLALTQLMNELDILDYGDSTDTEYPDPV